jgi:cytochrome c oxidase assembly factor CtaG
VRPWGIDLKTDQEIAGLIMWVGMNTYFLVLLTVIFLRWAGREERKDRDAMSAEKQRRRQARIAAQVDPASPAAVTES